MPCDRRLALQAQLASVGKDAGNHPSFMPTIFKIVLPVDGSLFIDKDEPQIVSKNYVERDHSELRKVFLRVIILIILF
jgi:hypothetical protein